jgi:DNA-binding IclR family transcriptional regulator
VAGTDGASGGVQAVGRALGLLKSVAEGHGPVTAADLAAASGLNRTTVWRMLSELEAHGFVTRSGDGGFTLGAAALTLGVATTRRFDPLVRLALPAMQALRAQTDETVILSVPYGGGVMTVEQLDSPQTVRLRNYLYEISPLTISSPGKALLASYSDAELDAVLAAREPGPDRSAFAAEIDRARADGYATVYEDLAPGESGIAAPIHAQGHVVALLNVSGPSVRLTPATMREIAPLLVAACTQVSALLSDERR